MEIIGYILTFVSGLFVGSFLNLVSDRLQSGAPIFVGRSKCDKCHRTLTPLELIPIIAFYLQRGHCKGCKTKLSRLYPLSEVLTGSMFVLAAYLSYLFTNVDVFTLIRFFYFVVVFSAYIVMFLSDVKFRIIPNKVVLPAIAFVFVFQMLDHAYPLVSSYIFFKNDSFGQYLLEVGLWQDRLVAVLTMFGLKTLSALGIFAFFWFLIFITKGKGMGGGDLKLALLIGLVNAFPVNTNILAIFLGFLTGAVYSLAMIAIKKKTMRDTIPFGPFLILGSLIALFGGNTLLNWYFGLFNS